MTNKEIIDQIRKSCLWMSIFACAFVVMYVGVVAFISFEFRYFSGYAPDIGQTALRAASYGVAAASTAALFYYRRRRNQAIAAKTGPQNFYDAIKFFINTVVLSLALSEVPLVCGFFMFFLGGLYWDFFALAALSLFLIVINTPGSKYISESLDRIW